LSAPSVHHSPVAIVGGGPVGLMLSLLLDLHGVRSVVFNAETTTRWHPKGNTHNSRTMEHYRRVGLSDAVRTLGLPADHPRDVTYFTRLSGWELARFSMMSERDRLMAARLASVTDQVPEPLVRVNQMYVERQMLEHARTRPNITVRFGWRVSSFEQDADGVSLTAIDPAREDAIQTWRTGYLVGCDGGQSFVRRSLGIGYAGPANAGDGFLSGRMFSTHVRIPALHRDLLARRKAWMYNVIAPDLRMLLISLDGADEFLLMTKPQAADMQPDKAAAIRHIQAGVGAPVDVDVLAHAVWNGGAALVAERFSDRRVYLAGDATHLFSPTGGFGMNTGIDGAANLAWKLAGEVQGWAGARLLQSYETERRPVAERNTAAARFLTQRVGELEVPSDLECDDARGATARARFGLSLDVFRGQFASLGVELGARYDGSPIICPDGEPPADDPLEYRPSSVPGGRLPHLWIDSADRKRASVFDCLHAGFTLLRIGRDAPDGDVFRAEARARRIPLEVVDIREDRALQSYQRRLLLVRPDQHIAWRGDCVPRDAGAVLDRVTGRR
jgi:2-polyprenyl-6-methoxyphenol hydroxylase-like FAD-dependent oxidoreductase